MADQPIETVTVPHRVVDLARRRTLALLRAAINHPNALEVALHSAYVQGLEDGYNAACHRATEGSHD